MKNIKALAAAALAATTLLMGACSTTTLTASPTAPEVPMPQETTVDKQQYPYGWGVNSIYTNPTGEGGPVKPDFTINEEYLNVLDGDTEKLNAFKYHDLAIGAGIRIINTVNHEDTDHVCSIADMEKINGAWYAKTAGHCFTMLPDDYSNYQVFTGDGQTLIGSLAGTPVHREHTGVDYAFIKLEPGFGLRNARVQGFEDYKIDYMNPDDIQPGMKVVKAGSTTGITAGYVLNKSPEAVSVNILTAHGDSGGTLFYEDESTKTLYLIGIASTGEDVPFTGLPAHSISVFSFLSSS